MTRREYGTGGLHQRRSDWRWIGTLETGWTTNGTRRRHTVPTPHDGSRWLQEERRMTAALTVALLDGLASVERVGKGWLPGRSYVSGTYVDGVLVSAL